jgi:hypothetical protein
MEKNAKIAIGIGVSVLTVATLIVFREQIKAFIMGRGKVSLKASKLATSEWKHWGEGKIKEGDASTMQRLRDYWSQGGGVNWSDERMTDEAWSAAFISYLMKKSGADDNFKYSTSHSQYIRAAINNRKQNNEKTFKGYRPEEVKIAVGDLVCYPRQSGVKYDSTNSYKSHCDIVIEVGKTEALSIGGNVSNSVTQSTLPIKNGKIDKIRDSKGYGGFFAVIKNK